MGLRSGEDCGNGMTSTPAIRKASLVRWALSEGALSWITTTVRLCLRASVARRQGIDKLTKNELVPQSFWETLNFRIFHHVAKWRESAIIVVIVPDYLAGVLGDDRDDMLNTPLGIDGTPVVAAPDQWAGSLCRKCALPHLMGDREARPEAVDFKSFTRTTRDVLSLVSATMHREFVREDDICPIIFCPVRVCQGPPQSSLSSCH